MRAGRGFREAARDVLRTMDPATTERVVEKAQADRITISEALRLLEPDLWLQVQSRAAIYPEW